MEELPVSGAVRTHTQHLAIKLTILYGHGPWCPKTTTVVTSKITDPHNKYSNNEKV